MVLGAAERHDDRPVGNGEIAGFLAAHEFLDDDLGARVSELAVEHVAQCRLGLRPRLGYDHPLARSEPVGLEDERRLEAVERGKGLAERRGADVAGGRDTRALAQVLGEAFAAFELRGRFRGTEHRHSAPSQRVRQPVDQWRLRPHDDEIDAPRLAEIAHRRVIGEVDLDRLGMLRDPRIARRGVKRTAVRGDEAGLRQLPCQRMFAPARSQQQDVHARPYSE